MPRRASASQENASLEVRDLWRSYGDRSVLKGIDLRLSEGELVCLMGDNGAGKTTLLDTILSRRAPERGELRFRGEAVQDGASRTAFLSACGVLGHDLGTFGDLTGEENLKFFASAFGKNAVISLDEMRALLDRAGLYSRKDDLARHYSRGMRQKLGICRCVLHKPSILFMDEPLTALDTGGVHFFFELLSEQRARACGLIVTHDRRPFERVADRFVRLERGVLQAPNARPVF